MNGSSLAIDISRVRGAAQEPQQDLVAVEEPLELQLNSPTAEGCAAKSISVTMRTPGDDAELALGFLFTEGIITHADDVRTVSAVGPAAGDHERRNTVRVELRPDVPVDLERLKRHFYTTSSCGVCGKTSLDAIRITGQASLRDRQTSFDRNVIVAMPDKLRTRQRIFSATGGLHAAAAFTPEGEIVALKEDVGRHNALDKVIGWLLKEKRIPGGGLGLLVSGRASFELMQKALVAGIPLLAAVGAPSSLAVQLAQEFDMTLIGFLREGNFNIYTGAQRVH